MILLVLLENSKLGINGKNLRPFCLHELNTSLIMRCIKLYHQLKYDIGLRLTRVSIRLELRSQIINMMEMQFLLRSSASKTLANGEFT